MLLTREFYLQICREIQELEESGRELSGYYTSLVALKEEYEEAHGEEFA